MAEGLNIIKQKGIDKTSGFMMEDHQKKQGREGTYAGVLLADPLAAPDEAGGAVLDGLEDEAPLPEGEGDPLALAEGEAEPEPEGVAEGARVGEPLNVTP